MCEHNKLRVATPAEIVITIIIISLSYRRQIVLAHLNIIQQAGSSSKQHSNRYKKRAPPPLSSQFSQSLPLLPSLTHSLSLAHYQSSVYSSLRRRNSSRLVRVVVCEQEELVIVNAT